MAELSTSHVSTHDAPVVEKDRGLLLVGLFKLSKAIFFTAVGVGAFRLLHHDLGDVVQKIVTFFQLDSANRLVVFLTDKADLVSHHQLRSAGWLSFAYAAVCVVEGIGLMRCKTWAEYLTITLTTLALPWEAYEILHHFTWMKVGVMAVNIAILLYLLWVVRKSRAKASRAAV